MRTGPFTTVNGLTIGNGTQFTPHLQRDEPHPRSDRRPRAGGQWTVLVDNIEGTGTPLQVIDPSTALRAPGSAATEMRRYFYRIIALP